MEINFTSQVVTLRAWLARKMGTTSCVRDHKRLKGLGMGQPENSEIVGMLRHVFI